MVDRELKLHDNGADVIEAQGLLNRAGAILDHSTHARSVPAALKRGSLSAHRVEAAPHVRPCRGG